MLKKLLLFTLVLTTLLAVGCGKSEDFSELSTPAVTVSQETSSVAEPVLYANPLTGVKEVEEDFRNLRPVAVMVNNYQSAQEVQCGLHQADIVYEAYVEGGISRLMAVFYDLSQVGQLGTIRSARNSFVYLAQGLDAVYAHHGVDNVYTKPYMRSIGLDDYNVGYVSGDSFRESNGKAWEHTLYTTGEKLMGALTKKEWRLKNDHTTPNAFVFAQEPRTPANPCTSVEFNMSSEYVSKFVYDQSSGKYTRTIQGETHKDYKNSTPTQVTNLFVLYANTVTYPDNKHVVTEYDKGKGIYVSAGGYQPITWEKGDPEDPLQFYDESGKELQVNPGSSWIAFPQKRNESKTVIQ